MSLRRVFIWNCDTCPAEAEAPHYGGPEGWRWYQGPTMPVKHACGACAALRLAEGWRVNPRDPKHIVAPTNP